MKIYVLSEWSGQDEFDTMSKDIYFSTKELALKRLNKIRNGFKTQVHGKPIFEFGRDLPESFLCKDSKWRHQCCVREVEVIESEGGSDAF